MTNQTLADRLIYRRKKLGLTQDEVAKPAGTTRVAISNIELGISTNIRATTLFAIAKALNNCNPKWLLTGEGSEELETGAVQEPSNVEPGPDIHQFVPEINWVQAGNWTSAAEDIYQDDLVMHPCPVKCSPGTFALRIRGDSMETRFEEGDLIFIDPEQLEPPSGKFVVAMMEGSSEATFKQLQILDGQKMLKALNPNYPPDMRYVKINGNCRLVGTVVCHIKPV